MVYAKYSLLSGVYSVSMSVVLMNVVLMSVVPCWSCFL